MIDAKKGESQHRPITVKERALIEWLLRHGNPSSEQFLEQLDSLVVVWKCSCGCPTVNFAREGKSAPHEAEHILADYLATVDGEDVGIILFQRGGRLSSLEVYSQAGTDKPFGLPEIETIYSYQELAKRQKQRNPVN
ncbi:MAG TPA: hypothetical protein VMX38_15715 [Verrucomicrobiae bacterium]|jgi:hypothetical protein|nr:hypothetical protein [Verrucomicrobiae bacterium]